MPEPSYPVFASKSKQGPSRPTGSLTWLWIFLGFGAAIGALFVIAPLAKGCSEDRERAEGEAQQQRDRDDAKACADAWNSDPRCVSYRDRIRAAKVNAPITCDRAGPRERIAWLDRPTRLRPDRATPRQLGFSIDDETECAVRIVSRAVSCGEAEVRDVFGEDPWLQEARQLGFAVLLCETVNGHKRTGYQIGDILSR